LLNLFFISSSLLSLSISVEVSGLVIFSSLSALGA